jgi:pSer/pThr/pTyr-binding forkhead associated (FHA) protein
VFEEGVTPFALSALKYGLLALLFLFVWRSMRWVIRGLAVDRPSAPAAAARGASAPAGDGPSVATLTVNPAEGKPHTVRLEVATTIGRAPECELRLDDTYASQQHARIFGRNGSWYVEDLGSTNGTFVNEQRLAAPAMLTPGDRIRVGTTVLELRR